MLRFVAIIALALAGLIRSPFFLVEISDVPAHALFYAALGAAQLMWAVFYLWQPNLRVAWLGLLLVGGSLALVLLSRLLAIPFTNIASPINSWATFGHVADVVAFAALLLHLVHGIDRIRRPVLLAMAASLGIGGLVWGVARLAEPSLPELAHIVQDQFEVFDQIDTLSSTDYAWDLPPGFPVPIVPANNPMTEAKVRLGRYLFYDTQLSGNDTMSCSSCHLPEKAFTDGLAVPIGSTGEAHTRNSQSLTNVAYNATYTWGNPILTTIEEQVVIPMFGEFPVEMGITGNEEVVLNRLAASDLYQQLFTAAFPDEAEPITFHSVVRSLASFVRTLISGDSAYDQFVYQGDTDALSESALRGLDLFLSERFECHHCHGGFNFSLSTQHANTTFSEQPFFNTGLYNIDDEGGYPSPNTGVYEITGEPNDMGRFRPPTLRNIALTAPYMHDGSMETLDEVIEFYSDGGRLLVAGGNAGDGRLNPNKSGFISGFEMTAQEKEDLINFLHSLSDESFTANPAFSDPFAP